MRVCKHCKIEFDLSVGLFANHVRWCDSNPKIEEHRRANSERGKALGDARFGKYKQFSVVCITCNNAFTVEEREMLFPEKEEYFCTRKCANSVGGRAKADKHHPDSEAHYTVVAWRHHEKKCVVCDEINVVAVHHLNENHEDNDPKNLVPLCPTHHIYMHSRFKEKILDQVTEYVAKKWK